LRPSIPSCCVSRDRARRAGTLPRTDTTLDGKLSTVRDLANHLTARGKHDWALADVHDIETFLAAQPKNRQRRLGVARQFFRFAKTHKIVLTDPTRGLTTGPIKGFICKTLTLVGRQHLCRAEVRDLIGERQLPYEPLPCLWMERELPSQQLDRYPLADGSPPGEHDALPALPGVRPGRTDRSAMDHRAAKVA